MPNILDLMLKKYSKKIFVHFDPIRGSEHFR